MTYRALKSLIVVAAAVATVRVLPGLARYLRLREL